ncbi:MAG: FAD-binding oxidoreductase, partial [Rhodospirillum sp.]|nr:FAD-binding oxidoreductase [Rhodospirillum sp.]
MTRRQADVVIIGGGVIGASIAHFLAADPDWSGSVVVVERDPTFQNGSTARSAASIRQQFSTPENVRISLFGIDFLRNLADHLSVDGEPPPDISLHEGGYLLLAATPEGETVLRDNHAIQQAEGADIALVTPDEMSARFPWMRVDDLRLGALGLSGEGWFDAFSLLQGFRRKAKSNGVEHIHDEVVGLNRQGDRITG